MSAAPTVVVVDDHADSLDVYSIALQHLGYRTIAASDGEEALRLIRKIRPDAVVADYHIPSIDGCELVKMLARDPATAGIPAIIVTADARPDVREEAEAAGCADFLLKPSSPSMLARRVRQLVDLADRSEEVA